jgi:hypothetical protein
MRYLLAVLLLAVAGCSKSPTEKVYEKIQTWQEAYLRTVPPARRCHETSEKLAALGGKYTVCQEVLADDECEQDRADYESAMKAAGPACEEWLRVYTVPDRLKREACVATQHLTRANMTPAIEQFMRSCR